MLDMLDQAWTLSPAVGLRYEPFGALAYHFGNRRLTFIKRSDLVAVIDRLRDSADLRSALVGAGVPEKQWERFTDALGRLAATDMIRPLSIDSSAAGSDVPSPPVTESVGRSAGSSLNARFEQGLSAPICLTWELTYACNLSCIHCLSSSGHRDPRELTTAECEAVIDELQAMQVFYVNIGGGEPTARADFWHILSYAVERHVGVKFSTNGFRISPERARFLASTPYVDVQVSLDGATREVNDAVRGPGSYDLALRALGNLASAGFDNAKISVVVTRHNVAQLDDLKQIADDHGATLRLTRLRPSGRGAEVWNELRLAAEQQRELYDWLRQHGEGVLTGDSFFHLAGYGESLPGLNLCGAGRVVCLIDPVGDVYACPFAIHDQFLAGNVRSESGFAGVWSTSQLFQQLRSPQTSGACTKCQFFDSCRGGCMAAKFFTGLPLDGPDPECVQGYGEQSLANGPRQIPRPSQDHSRSGHTARPEALLQVGRPGSYAPPARACDESPVPMHSGFGGIER